MMSLAACVTGFFLDRLFGDPVWLYHPVRMIGNMISFLEKKIISNRQRKAPGLRLHGIPALFVRPLRICGYG